MTRVLVMHGPNLDRLGSREPEIYGHTTLAAITATLDDLARQLGLALEHYQSNAEHELVDRVHQAGDSGVAWLLINPAAFTHTSVALRDALSASALRFVEIHLSNPDSREPFRKTNLFSDLASGRICGFGALGYELGLRAIAGLIETSAANA
ncbi:MAG: type II 3-dehydroquinate dehydratase [Pseudomonadota bacterium]